MQVEGLNSWLEAKNAYYHIKDAVINKYGQPFSGSNDVMSFWIDSQTTIYLRLNGYGLSMLFGNDVQSKKKDAEYQKKLQRQSDDM